MREVSGIGIDCSPTIQRRRRSLRDVSFHERQRPDPLGRSLLISCSKSVGAVPHGRGDALARGRAEVEIFAKGGRRVHRRRRDAQLIQLLEGAVVLDRQRPRVDQVRGRVVHASADEVAEGREGQVERATSFSRRLGEEFGSIAVLEEKLVEEEVSKSYSQSVHSIRPALTQSTSSRAPTGPGATSSRRPRHR